jgi:flagellar basal-body rod modification protein FlgD
MQDVADRTTALLDATVAFGASALIGRDVTYLDEAGESVSGVVGAVTYGATGPVISVGDASISLSQIQTVGAPAAATP